MPLVRISLAFQHNSWAKRCTLPHLSSFYTLGRWNIFPYKMAGAKVPCVPPTAVHLLTWTFMVYHAATKTLAFCSPVIYFPSFTSRFVRHSFPYSALYRSLVLRHPTLLSLGMTGAKPLNFKSRPPQILMAPRKPNKFQNGTAHGPKWKLGRAGNVPWKVWISKMQNAQKRQQSKSMQNWARSSFSKNSTNFRQTDH